MGRSLKQESLWIVRLVDQEDLDLLLSLRSGGGREIQREVKNVEARSRWVRGEQVQDVAGSVGGRHGELRRQHRSQEPLYHLR